MEHTNPLYSVQPQTDCAEVINLISYDYVSKHVIFIHIMIPTDDLIPKTRRGRNQPSLAFQIPLASNDVYKYSFFPQTIRDWNDLPESLISSSKLSDDSVSKFTSLVRARD